MAEGSILLFLKYYDPQVQAMGLNRQRYNICIYIYIYIYVCMYIRIYICVYIHIYIYIYIYISAMEGGSILLFLKYYDPQV